jgi:hypothetical protein
MIHNLIRRKQFALLRVWFRLPTESLNGIHELIDIIEPPMHRRITQVSDFIDAAQFLQNFGANVGGLDFATAGFEIVHDFIDELFEGEQTGGAFFESFGNAARKLAPIEWFVGAVAFHHPKVRAFDLFVSSESVSAFKTLATAANAGAIARLSGINHLVITRAALGATHSVKRLNNTPRVVASTLFNAWN